VLDELLELGALDQGLARQAHEVADRQIAVRFSFEGRQGLSQRIRKGLVESRRALTLDRRGCSKRSRMRAGSWPVDYAGL
jgi:hypothetical protein